MTDPRRSGWWRKQRRIYAATLPTPCGWCHRPVRPGDEWDLSHVVAVVNGGGLGAVEVWHRSCNRRDGAVIAAGRRHRTAPPSRDW